jgi:hypothetical protein
VHRSLCSSTRRVAAAGAAAAIALTLFNAVQPSLGTRVDPGTIEDVPLTLTAAAAGPVATTAGKRANVAAKPATAVAADPAADTAGPRRQSEHGTPPASAADPAADPGTGRAAVSAPIAVGKARFVGFSWPNPDAARQGAAAAGQPAGASGTGRVWLRTRTAAGWSAA